MSIVSDEEILQNGVVRVEVAKQIEICFRCKGTGTYVREELTCYHRREYDYFPELCTTCNGSGLVAQITKRPYVQLPYGAQLSGYEPYQPRGPKPNE